MSETPTSRTLNPRPQAQVRGVPRQSARTIASCTWARPAAARRCTRTCCAPSAGRSTCAAARCAQRPAPGVWRADVPLSWSLGVRGRASTGAPTTEGRVSLNPPPQSLDPKPPHQRRGCPHPLGPGTRLGGGSGLRVLAGFSRGGTGLPRRARALPEQAAGSGGPAGLRACLPPVVLAPWRTSGGRRCPAVLCCAVVRHRSLTLRWSAPAASRSARAALAPAAPSAHAPAVRRLHAADGARL